MAAKTFWPVDHACADETDHDECGSLGSDAAELMADAASAPNSDTGSEDSL